MPREYLKKATKTAQTGEAEVSRTVATMLADIEENGEPAARRYTAQLDGYKGPVVLSADDIAEACATTLPLPMTTCAGSPRRKSNRSATCRPKLSPA